MTLKNLLKMLRLSVSGSMSHDYLNSKMKSNLLGMPMTV